VFECCNQITYYEHQFAWSHTDVAGLLFAFDEDTGEEEDKPLLRR